MIHELRQWYGGDLDIAQFCKDPPTLVGHAHRKVDQIFCCWFSEDNEKPICHHVKGKKDNGHNGRITLKQTCWR